MGMVRRMGAWRRGWGTYFVVGLFDFILGGAAAYAEDLFVC